MRRGAERVRRGLRVALLAGAALTLGGCLGANRSIPFETEDNVTVRDAPDEEFVQQVVIVLRAYAEPYLGAYLPRQSPIAWSVTVADASAPGAAATPPLGYDPATRAIVIHARAGRFPRDLLHAAALAWLDRSQAEAAQGDRAGATWWVSHGMPLAAEGLAAAVWRGQGSVEARRDAVEADLAADHLVVGTPVDRLAPLAADVQAGTAWTLAQLAQGPPAVPSVADAYAWALCSFLLHGGRPGRDLLARAATAATASPDPLAAIASASADERRWQAYLATVVRGVQPPR